MRIIGCITYSNIKLGPRLVGTVNDWNLVKFTKEQLFSIIYDSITIRNNNAILFAKDRENTPYRIFIYKINRPFFDIHYSGEYYAFCLFIPYMLQIQRNFRKLLRSFNWEKLIGIDGNIKNLVEELEDILNRFTEIRPIDKKKISKVNFNLGF